MRPVRATFFLLMCIGLASAQTALYNGGNLRLHNNAQMGLHTDLINDAAFDNNLGLVGFYGNGRTISGSVVPLLHDVEVVLNTSLRLATGLDVANNLNFITGNVATNRLDTGTQLTFLEEAFYVGESDMAKVDGYAAMTNRNSFIFPVGSAAELRPLVLNAQGNHLFAQCAYFLEDPNAPFSLPGTYDTNNVERALGFVSNVEFWQLQGSVPSTITINWNPNSDMAALTADAALIVPVGWSIAENEWKSLGSTGFAGTLDQGFVTSDTFVPSDYAIIALGVTRDALEPLESDLFDLDNFYVSANGDGINDALVIPQLERSPNNRVKIYDRFGLKVFDQQNYIDEFRGVANVGNLVIAREEGLPVGVYFYTVHMADLDLNYQGFLYLSR
jgi:gliding motility-associated-like protein